MSFDRFRESITNIQKLSDNLTSLKKADLNELYRLNAECLSLNEEIVKSFSDLVDEIEEGLTLLLDRLDQIKKDLARISGPEGTLGDILQMEPAWSGVNALHGNIRSLLESPQYPAGRDTATKSSQAEAGPKVDTPSPAAKEAALDAESKESKEIQDLIGIARKEAAASAEKAPAAKPVPVAKNQKKVPPQAHNSKPALLSLNKNCGETEKKLMEEITKNMEAIKSSKKKI